MSRACGSGLWAPEVDALFWWCADIKHSDGSISCSGEELGLEAVRGLGGDGERIGKEARTNTVPINCEDVGFGREYLHTSEGFEGRNVDGLLFHSWT